MKQNTTKPKTSLDLVSNLEPDAFYFRKLESQGIFLNEHQVEAVRSPAKTLLASCAAGSGKSLSIIAKAGYLIAVEGINPENVLAITFTRKAAEELRLRLRMIIYDSNVQASTIHGFCYRVLIQNKYKGWKLISSDRQRISIIKWLMKCNNLLVKSNPENIVTSYSYYKNANTHMNEALCDSSLLLFNLYEEYKLSKQLFDFDDLLTTMLHILKTDSLIVQKLQRQFKYILFDEIQDTSPIILDIIKLLAKDSHLHVYGDIRQSIYSFRGSDIKMIEEFPYHFEDTRKISFNYNYRSSVNIVQLANSVIGMHHGRFEDMVSVKSGSTNPTIIEFDTSIQEAQYIIHQIAKSISQNSKQYSDYAILYRTGAAAASIIDELSLRNIPFKIIGAMKLIYDESVSKFILAHLSLSLDEFNVDALFEIAPSLNIPRRLLMSQLDNGLPMNLKSISSLLSFQRLHSEILQDRMRLIKSILLLPPQKAIESLLADESIRQYLGIAANTAEAEESNYILEQLKLSAGRFSLIQDFLDFIDDLKNKATDNADKNRNSITLSSIHGSKGLEFKHVYLIGAVEGIIPHRHTIDPIPNASEDIPLPSPPPDINEELRIMYVAITRAKEVLTITCPKHIGMKETQVSRFLRPFIG